MASSLKYCKYCSFSAFKFHSYKFVQSASSLWDKFVENLLCLIIAQAI